MISENLDELSPLLRTAFVLREVQGYSTGEAAKKLGVTENTLKARLWRARHQMAERLGRRLRRVKDGNAGGMGEAGCRDRQARGNTEAKKARKAARAIDQASFCR